MHLLRKGFRKSKKKTRVALRVAPGLHYTNGSRVSEIFYRKRIPFPIEVEQPLFAARERGEKSAKRLPLDLAKISLHWDFRNKCLHFCFSSCTDFFRILNRSRINYVRIHEKYFFLSHLNSSKNVALPCTFILPTFFYSGGYLRKSWHSHDFISVTYAPEFFFDIDHGSSAASC